jgi:quercetin dioxygenase-like cupin family protein
MDEWNISPRDIASARTPRPLAATKLLFAFDRELELLKAEDVWSAHGHNARTLIKHDEFRVVLIVLAKGKAIREHETYRQVMLQGLSGKLRVQLRDEQLPLSAGELLALDRMVSHDIEALEDSAFLLTVGWSAD